MNDPLAKWPEYGRKILSSADEGVKPRKDWWASVELIPARPADDASGLKCKREYWEILALVNRIRDKTR